MEKLNIIFMGTPDFALTALQALYEAGHNILAVYCQPPREKGRGKKIQKNSTHIWADEQGIAVLTPLNFKNSEDVDFFKSLNADVAVVAAYGLILPQSVLSAPRLGCVNIHGSILPRWRGAAPIQRAIMAGDTETGITTMLMDVGLDTGDILEYETLPIYKETSTIQLYKSMADLGAKLICTTLDKLAKQQIQPVKQPEIGVTYAHKLLKEEGKLDFSQNAHKLFNIIKGLTPQISIWYEAKAVKFKILKVQVHEENFEIEVGALMQCDKHLYIQCGQFSLEILIMQPEGGVVMQTEDFLRGYPHVGCN
jgi:methionyl-tRNA formyltransferase